MAERCTACGASDLAVEVGPFTFAHGGRKITIDDLRTACRSCGTVSYAGDQIARHECAVADKIRELDGLLSADELRHVRLKYGFRQTDMEAMLSIGPKTWTRWERGKVPQSKAADTLIRILADDASVARRLMQQANVDNPSAQAILDQIDMETKRRAEARLRSQIDLLAPDLTIEDLARRAVDAVLAARQISVTGAVDAAE